MGKTIQTAQCLPNSIFWFQYNAGAKGRYQPALPGDPEFFGKIVMDTGNHPQRNRFTNFLSPSPLMGNSWLSPFEICPGFQKNPIHYNTEEAPIHLYLIKIFVKIQGKWKMVVSFRFVLLLQLETIFQLCYTIYKVIGDRRKL